MNALGPWSGNEQTAAAGGIVYSTYVARFLPSCCAFLRAKGRKVGSRYKCRGGRHKKEGGEGKQARAIIIIAMQHTPLPLPPLVEYSGHSRALRPPVQECVLEEGFCPSSQSVNGAARGNTGAQITFTEVSVWRRRRRKEINRNGLSSPDHGRADPLRRLRR